jgi:hypothetical protein
LSPSAARWWWWLPVALGCNSCNPLRWVATRSIGAATRPQVTVEAYRKEVRARKRLHNELIELKGNIRVICRVRPVRYPRRAFLRRIPRRHGP